MRRLFAFFGFNECNGDITTVMGDRRLFEAEFVQARNDH